MKADLFLDDLHRKPATLRDLAGWLRREDPWRVLGAGRSAPRHVVLLGMGSSAYAAEVAAARMRHRGILAVAELASTDLLPHWGPDTLVVAVSATGGSRETVDAVGRMATTRTVALTNTADSELAERTSSAVPLRAGDERGGVACRTFQHTVALLLALEQHLTGRSLGALADVIERSADATEHLLATTPGWLDEVVELTAGPHGTHLVAPARRMSSARQGALMLREGPRRAAVACEAGDWAHVDVYLTKNTDYRLIAFAGSAWDDGILEWTRPRGTTVVAVGGSFTDAQATVRYPHDDEDDVRLLTEVLVPELVAARLWTAS